VLLERHVVAGSWPTPDFMIIRPLPIRDGKPEAWAHFESKTALVAFHLSPHHLSVATPPAMADLEEVVENPYALWSCCDASRLISSRRLAEKARARSRNPMLREARFAEKVPNERGTVCLRHAAWLA